MKHEETARKNHRSGYSCATSVTVAFADTLGLTPAEAMRTAPRPRSEGGKCGAFLAGKKVLEQLKPEAVPEYERRFIELYGQTECTKLLSLQNRLRKSCNDYVGDAARLVEEALS